MVKIHGGSGRPQGVLNHGTAPKPSPYHGGTNLKKVSCTRRSRGRMGCTAGRVCVRVS